MKLKILLVLFSILTINQIASASNSTTIKIIVTVTNKESSIFEKVEENIYHALIENINNKELIFNSEADIQSFPRKKTLKPGDKQLFKLVAKNKESINIFYELNNKKYYIKTFNDLKLKK